MGVPLIYLSEYSIPIFSFVFCDELTKLRIMHDIHLISLFCTEGTNSHLQANDFCAAYGHENLEWMRIGLLIGIQ